MKMTRTDRAKTWIAQRLAKLLPEWLMLGMALQKTGKVAVSVINERQPTQHTAIIWLG